MEIKLNSYSFLPATWRSFLFSARLFRLTFPWRCRLLDNPYKLSIKRKWVKWSCMVKMLSMPLSTAVECPSSFRRMEMAADDKEWMVKKKKTESVLRECRWAEGKPKNANVDCSGQGHDRKKSTMNGLRDKATTHYCTSAAQHVNIEGKLNRFFKHYSYWN